MDDPNPWDALDDEADSVEEAVCLLCCNSQGLHIKNMLEFA